MTSSRLPTRWRVLQAIVATLVRVARWRLDVRGLEHVPVEGGAVLAFNHHSYADFLMVGLPIVRERTRPVRFLAKREIWASPWTGWAVRWAGAVPVDRSSQDARSRAYDAAIVALAGGDLVAVAPEQTISPSFDLLPFRTGAVRMAQQAGVPIIPVIGWGTQRFSTKGRRAYATGIPVIVSYGEPIHVAVAAEPAVVTEQLRAVMAEQLDHVQRTYADQPRPGDDWWQPARLGGSAPSHADIVAAHERRQQAWRKGHTAEEEREAS